MELHEIAVGPKRLGGAQRLDVILELLSQDLPYRDAFRLDVVSLAMLLQFLPHLVANRGLGLCFDLLPHPLSGDETKADEAGPPAIGAAWQAPSESMPY